MRAAAFAPADPLRTTSTASAAGGVVGTPLLLPPSSAAAPCWLARRRQPGMAVMAAARSGVRARAASSNPPPTSSTSSSTSAAASSSLRPSIYSTSAAATGIGLMRASHTRPGFPSSPSPTSSSSSVPFLLTPSRGGSGSPPRARGGPSSVAVAASGGSSSGAATATGSGNSNSRRGSVATAASSGAAAAYNSQALGMSSAGAAARRRFAANRRNGNGGSGGNSNNPLVLLYDRAAAAVGDLSNATSNVLPSLFDMVDTLEFELTELAGQLATSLASSGLMDAMGLLDGSSTGGMENELGDLLGQLADAVVAASEGDYSKLLLLAYVTIAVGWNASRPPPSPYLTGNYGPVHDTLRAGNLPILNYPAASFTSAAGVGSSAGSSTTAYGAATANGVLPEGLPDGYYVRAGPNPYHKPAAGYHWFDGDGMLHGVRLRRGSAAYANAWVDTERLKQERALGHPMLFRIGDMVGVKGIALMLLGLFAERVGTVHLDKGTGTANTAVAFHAGRLLALHDDDLPYAVRVADDGGIETTGRLEYKAAGGAQAQSLPNLVSHPKVDPVNGETQNCEVYLVLRRRCSDRRQLRIRLHEMFAPRWGRDPPDQNEATFAKSALCSLLST